MSRTLYSTAPGKLEALLCTFLLLSITILLPTYFKNWFVEPTGNLKIAPYFGFVFGVGILLGRTWARTGALILTWGVGVISLFSIISDGMRPGFWILLAMATFLLYLLHTERLKQYFE